MFKNENSNGLTNHQGSTIDAQFTNVKYNKNGLEDEEKSKLGKYFNIKKSKNDKNEYMYKVLKNNLKCILIYDKDADKSSAALTVEVGSLVDPEEFQGLAHFLEHMLFMGTEKYPKENDFSEFLSKNSGDSNAYTGLDTTQYYFDVKNEAFLDALDRFAQFFIKPLFVKSAVEREMKAVESEHKKNMRSDSNRLLEIFRYESHENTPFAKFQTGSLETLKKPGVRKVLKKFHREFYSSNIMNLCLYSNIPLDRIENVVDELFGQIKELETINKQDIVQSFIPSQIYPYSPGLNLGHFYKVQNIKEKNILSFYWVLNENLNKFYKIEPLEYVNFLVGHEGPNSLTSSLLKDVLITDLESSYDVIAHTFTQFYINIILTQKGFDNCDEVIRRVIHFVQKIQSLGVNKKSFEEIQRMGHIDFDHFEKDEPVNFCSEMSENMIIYEPEDVITGQYIIEHYDEELIKKFTNMLQLDNLNIYLGSNKFTDEFSSEDKMDVEEVLLNKQENFRNSFGLMTKNHPVLTEKWYGTKYKKIKFELNSLFNLNLSKENLLGYTFGHPPENHFIPQKFELKDYNVISSLESGNLSESYKFPKIIADKEDFYKVWYKPDFKFKIPKVYLNAHVYLPYSKLSNNIDFNHYEAYLTLWHDIFYDELRETIYMGSLARIDFAFYNDKMGLIIELSGFDHTIKNFADEIFSIFKKISTDYRTIENLRNKMLFNIENRLRIERDSLKGSASSQVSNALSSLLCNFYLTAKKNIEILEELKAEILERDNSLEFGPPAKFEYFLKNYLTHSFFEWLVQGNILPSEGMEIVENIQNYIQTKGMKMEDLNQVRTVKIPESQNPYYTFESHDEGNENSAILSYFQVGYLSEKESCMLELIEQIFYDKFFDELRTKQTLGYVVSLAHRFNRKIEGISCVVQSNVQCPEYIYNKITDFFEDYNLTDESNLSDEDFANFVDAIISRLRQKDLTLAEEVDKNFSEIKIREYFFNREEERIKILENQIKKQDVIDFYEEHFINNVRRVDIELVAKTHMKDNEKLLEKNLSKFILENDNEVSQIPRKKIEHIDGFKRMCELFPDYYYYIFKK